MLDRRWNRAYRAVAYSSNPEVSENTPGCTSRHTAVLNLRRPGVGVHLRELQLGLGADTLGQRGVSDYVAEGLSIATKH